MIKVYNNTVCECRRYSGILREIRLMKLDCKDVTHTNGCAEFNNFAKKFLSENLEKVLAKIEKINNQLISKEV